MGGRAFVEGMCIKIRKVHLTREGAIYVGDGQAAIRTWLVAYLVFVVLIICCLCCVRCLCCRRGACVYHFVCVLTALRRYQNVSVNIRIVLLTSFTCTGFALQSLQDAYVHER